MSTKTKRKNPLPKEKKTTRVTVDFPEAQHRELKALAALEGVILQEYIRSRIIVSSKDVDASNEEVWRTPGNTR
jgi:predicted DNA binding CopG/RHH family protein